MNKAVTDGVVFMPTPFSAGLDVWSRGDGTPGSDTYAGFATAAFVPADEDFGGCLEIQKTEGTQRLRYMVDTPILPGCYLRVTARLKAMAGVMPAVRIAAWAGRDDGTEVSGLATTGASVQLARRFDGRGGAPWATGPRGPPFTIDIGKQLKCPLYGTRD